MELWGVIFGGIGVVAGAVAIVYAHIAYRGSKEPGKAATDANTLARESTDIAKDRRCDSEHMRSADPIAARFPRILTRPIGLSATPIVGGASAGSLELTCSNLLGRSRIR
jgi:hypothetical protein